MEAALITGQETIEILEFPEPEPVQGHAVVEIGLCGICGTDLEPWVTGNPYSPSICGHEWMGTASGVGAGVAHIREGDRVGVGAAPACGSCGPCRAGHASHCELTLNSVLGMGPFATAHGGFAPRIGIDARRLYTVRDGISDTSAAMLEPATVAVHAVRRTALHMGDACLVLGAGPIGLFTLQAALANGAGAVAVIEPHPTRRNQAALLGASAVIDPSREDVSGRVREVFGTTGPDVVFECAGIPTTIQQAAELVRRGGVISLLGLSAHDATISPGTWLLNEVTLIASLAYTAEEFETTMGLMQDGRMRVAGLHSSTSNLADLTNAFQRLRDTPDEIKILVDPHLCLSVSDRRGTRSCDRPPSGWRPRACARAPAVRRSPPCDRARSRSCAPARGTRAR